MIICPVDNRPCELSCPDRYTDTPDGGCILTTAQEMGCTVIVLGDDALIVHPPM